MDNKEMEKKDLELEDLDKVAGGWTMGYDPRIMDCPHCGHHMLTFPIPRREKERSSMVKSNVKTGITNAANVITRLSSTVFLRPILFISRLVGMLKIRNHRNTSEGRVLAMESLRFRSAFT